MSIKIEHLIKELREVAAQAEHVGAVGMLIEQAIEVIVNLQADLKALQQMGSDHG